MQVDWRTLLSAINVPWIDKGRNTSRNNVNIACPWCYSDPSHHLGISLAKEAFYCYRDPNRHSGRSFVSLLMRLGQTREEAIRLINFHRERDRHTRETPQAEIDPVKTRSAWDRFSPAYESAKCVDYLRARGYAAPKVLCEQYDLRYAREGTWAQRLLIPLHHEGEVISWTGRDLTGRLEVKYLSRPVVGYQMLYTPDINKPNRDVAVLVEGPLDALRVSSATRRAPYVTIALCGKALGAQKLLAIRKAAQGCSTFLVALDADVAMSLCYQIVAEIAGAVKVQFIGRAKLPSGLGDPGELEAGDIIPWLNRETTRIRANRQLSKHEFR